MLEPAPLERDDIRRYLASTALFRDLDESTFSSVEAELDRMTLDTGDTLMEQGALGDSLFVLVSGRLRVFVRSETGAEDAVGEISPGEAVGEMALISDEPRSATVRCIRPSLVVRLSRAGFERLEARHPQIMKQVARTLVRRLRQVNVAREDRPKPLTIGIVAATPDVDLMNFCRLLADALSRIDSTYHLNVPFIESQFGLGFTNSPIRSEHGQKLSTWISEQERHYRFVLYESSGPKSEWTQRAIRHSDRIFVVVPSGKTPLEGLARFVNEELAESAARKDLVFIHSGMDRTASGTSAWLDAIPAQEHCHVWLYSSQDFDRLARLISGRAFGLVLGGGGARGFAHIGVIQALNEKNIPIDFVGGTSIGALIAAEFAMDWSADRMRKANREAFRSHPLRGDYKTPMVSLAESSGSDQLYDNLFGEHQIEDQCRNYFAVSCNLTRGEAVIHRRGRFKECVQASCALPVLDPPLFSNGDLIVDGALINNLPADVMKSICDGRVIAVDVSPRRDLRSQSAETQVTGWESSRVVRSRVQAASTAPNSFSIVMRTIMLNSVISADSMKRHIDVYLKPPIEEVEMFDWMAIDDIIEIGYRHAIDKLKEARVIFGHE